MPIPPMPMKYTELIPFNVLTVFGSFSLNVSKFLLQCVHQHLLPPDFRYFLSVPVAMFHRLPEKALRESVPSSPRYLSPSWPRFSAPGSSHSLFDDLRRQMDMEQKQQVSSLHIIQQLPSHLLWRSQCLQLHMHSPFA